MTTTILVIMILIMTITIIILLLKKNDKIVHVFDNYTSAQPQPPLNQVYRNSSHLYHPILGVDCAGEDCINPNCENCPNCPNCYRDVAYAYDYGFPIGYVGSNYYNHGDRHWYGHVGGHAYSGHGGGHGGGHGHTGGHGGCHR